MRGRTCNHANRWTCHQFNASLFSVQNMQHNIAQQRDDRQCLLPLPCVASKKRRCRPHTTQTFKVQISYHSLHTCMCNLPVVPIHCLKKKYDDQVEFHVPSTLACSNVLELGSAASVGHTCASCTRSSACFRAVRGNIHS